jgi:hypothetical protein
MQKNNNNYDMLTYACRYMSMNKLVFTVSLILLLYTGTVHYIVLSRVTVTKDGVPIGDWIY